MMNATERSSRTDFNLHKTRRKICCIILSSSHVVCLNWLLYSISKQDQLLKNETTIKSAQEAETTVADVPANQTMTNLPLFQQISSCKSSHKYK